MRTRRGLCIVGIVVGLGAGIAPPGLAGGGAMISFDQDVYVPGDLVTGRTMTWLTSTSGGGHLEDGPYFAYLSRSTKGQDMPPLRPTEIPLGRVEVDPRGNGRYGMATVRFTLPPVEPGRYWVSHCNDPCTTTLGDLMPTQIVVASDAGEARLVKIADRLTERMRSLRHRVVNRVLGSQRTLSTRVEELERRVEALQSEVAAKKDAALAPREPQTSSSLAPLLAFVVPAAALGALLGRRSRRTE